MPVSARISLSCLVGFLLCGSTGCVVPQQAYMQSQYRAVQLCQQNRALAMDRDNLRTQLSVANKRFDNLQADRSELQRRYINILNQAKNQKSPLSESTTRRLEELQSRYPMFEFDPQTGVSKFGSDILFNSGSADLKPEASPLLKEFASIMNDNDAKALNILVVGHTDDKPIAKEKTRSQHPTNWHLSTNRANSVLLELGKAGIKERRMGAAGYSMYQPVRPNKDDESRRHNRRVEIYVLSPDAVVAGWDPAINLD
ncbi:MAG: OmpA family protein [Planctomycetaceae bacterium]